MEQISAPRKSLNGYFGWSKARMACFVQMLLALMLTRTVNLNKLACVFMSEATQLSSYRRMQRFFAQFKLEYDRLAGFIFRLFFVPGGQMAFNDGSYQLAMGYKANINILTLGIAFKGTAIPIYWVLLNKKGNSDTAERIALMQKFIKRFGKDCIANLLAEKTNVRLIRLWYISLSFQGAVCYLKSYIRLS